MNTLAGTGKLVRLILRRDRLLMPVWILALAVIPISFVSSFNELFPTAAARQEYADASADNGAFVALYGRVFGSDLGEMVAWRAGFMPIMVGLFSLLTVIRHTRTEEEAGRRELLGATVVGRHASLAAALVATFGANVVLAVLLALIMMSQGLPAAGSVAFGAELAAAGWVFAAVGGVTAQLTEGAGAARGIAVSVLGAAYLLRIAGDLSGQAGGGLSWLSWLSPIGWVHRIYPYGGDRWWILALVAGLTAALAAAAVALSARRDLGAGLLPARPGPAGAAPGLRTPLALAWRLHRGLLAAWIAGLAAGLVHGLNTGDIGRELPRVWGAAMVQLPAVWVLAATAVALFGLLPRLAAVSWGALAICVLIGLVGAAVQLNQRLLDVSPFTHIPKVPGAAVSATPLVWLASVAVVLVAAGLTGFRRRDVPVS